MKEMVYTNRYGRYGEKDVVLDSGTYKGFDYCIMSLGTHPTAYVRIPTTHFLYDKVDYETTNIDFHFGVTYARHSEFDGKEGYWIGCDYSHYGDYYFDNFDGDGKKWTTAELKESILKAIDSIVVMKEKDFISDKISDKLEEISGFRSDIDKCLETIKEILK